MITAMTLGACSDIFLAKSGPKSFLEIKTS